MNATRQLEYVCFFPASIPTEEKDTYVFLSIDCFSHYAFNTGFENTDSPENVLKHIYLLTEHPDFLVHMNNGFTLVLHKYKELESIINNIINPIQGKVIFDPEYVNKMMVPILKGMLQHIKKK
jgi:hypothetical protein